MLWLTAGGAFIIAHLALERQADAVALGALVLTLAVFILPSLSRLKLPGGAEFELRQSQQQTASELNVESPRLTADLSYTLVQYTGALATIDLVLSRDSASTLAGRYAYALLRCRKLLVDSLKWFAVDEPVRILVYQFHSVTDWGENVLEFVTGNVTDVESQMLSAEYFTLEGEDPVSRSWRDHVLLNLEDVAADDRPRLGPGNGAAYCGIMMVPIRREDEPWGMVVIERTASKRFDATAERVATALADVVAAILGHHTLRLVSKPKPRRRRPTGLRRLSSVRGGASAEAR